MSQGQVKQSVSSPCPAAFSQVPYKSNGNPQTKGNYWSEFRRLNKARPLFASSRSHFHHKMGDGLSEFHLSKVFLVFRSQSGSDLARPNFWPSLFITFDFKAGIQDSLPSSARRVSLISGHSHCLLQQRPFWAESLHVTLKFSSAVTSFIGSLS